MNDKQKLAEIHKQCAIELAATVIFACGTRKFRQIIIPAAIVEQSEQHFENGGDMLIAKNKDGDLIITLVQRLESRTPLVRSSTALWGRADKQDTDKLPA